MAACLEEMAARGFELTIVGHSMGGGVATLLAMLLRPHLGERVRECGQMWPNVTECDRM